MSATSALILKPRMTITNNLTTEGESFDGKY